MTAGQSLALLFLVSHISSQSSVKKSKAESKN